MILNFPIEVSPSSSDGAPSVPARERLFRMGEAPRGGGDRERWSWAVLIAALAHVGLAAAAMGLPAQARPEVKPPAEPELVFMHLAPPPAPSAHASPVRSERVKPRTSPRRPVVVPRIIQERPLPPPTEPEPSVAEEEPSEAPADAQAPESLDLGDSVAGVIGGVLGGLEGGLVGATGEALGLKQVARPPGVLEQVRPHYPRAARSDGIEGTVLVRVIIGVDGRIEPGSAQVVRSVAALDAAALAAVNQWRFSPALGHQGRPVRVIVEIPLQFSLK